jgi:nucleotide-binding universal stress UspA family protein
MTEIVVGVDGSEQSAEALRWAAREAELRTADLTAVLVWDLFNQRHPDGSKAFDPAYDESKADAALLAAVEAALGADAVATVVRKTPCDVPAKGLLAAAEGADLLVVGARGLGGFRGLLLGSVSQQCLHHAPGPVAIVRAVQSPDPTERVVVGVDGSPSADAALRWALTEAALRGGTMQVVHAWEVPVIFGPVAGGGLPYDTDAVHADAQRFVDELVDAAVAETGTPDVAVERTTGPGGAASAVLDAAEGADLVVIGRRGAGGFSRLLLGSVSENVARHAPCPVVVMPPERDPGT